MEKEIKKQIRRMIRQTLNESFFGIGTSKKDKELQKDIEKAKKEIDNYDFKRLWTQGTILPRILDIKKHTPTLAKLLPEFFKTDQSKGQAVLINRDKELQGYIPEKFYYLTGKGNKITDESINKLKEYLKKQLDKLL